MAMLMITLHLFSSKNNLEQITLIRDLSLVQYLHDNVPLEITSFEAIPLKVDEDHSSTR
jgi:hypothetical protein